MIRRIIAAGVLALACLAVLASTAVAIAADAAAPAGIVIPVGDIVAQLSGLIAPAALTVLTWVVGRWVPAVIRPILTDQLLSRALDYGLGAVEGAAKGRVLTVPVASEVIRQAAQYVVDHGSPKLLKWIGDTIEDKLVARLSSAGALPPEASAENLRE